MTRYGLTYGSGNRKTGPIAVSTVARASCPPCPLKDGGGCYAETGRVRWNWAQVSRAGFGIDRLAKMLRALPRGAMFRHAVAGDLPGRGAKIDARELARLSDATAHLIAWTYTHKRDFRKIRAANARPGLTVNLSADSLEEADRLSELAAGPVVVTLPTYAPTPQRTPAGRMVAVCPAQLREGTTCASCGDGSPLCARRDRDYLIGFRAHGARRKAISARLTADAGRGET